MLTWALLLGIALSIPTFYWTGHLLGNFVKEHLE
jgi:hypothetical protein